MKKIFFKKKSTLVGDKYRYVPCGKLVQNFMKHREAKVLLLNLLCMKEPLSSLLQVSGQDPVHR